MRGKWAVGVISFIVGLLVVPAGIFLYLEHGRPPVAVADPSFPFERQIVRGPLHARIDAEAPKATMEASEQNLVAGATVYKQQCAFCHGLPGAPAQVGANMFPSAPQLWAKHRNGVVGVSDDPAGETFWRVKNGIRLTGMPSYQKLLSEDQMWQVSLLLHNASEPQSPAVQQVLAEK